MCGGEKKIKMASVVSSTNSQIGPTTDTTNKLPIILIVGKSIENINKITNALKTHHFQKCIAGDNINSGTNTHGIFDTFTADIVTKYYTASVNVWTLIKSPDEILGKYIPDGCKAIISTYDALTLTQSSLENSAKSWIDACKNRVGTKVFALTYVDSKEIETVKCLDKLNDWTFDNQIEYVKTNMKELKQDKTKREKEGIARAYECLETTMWPNMKRASRRSSSNNTNASNNNNNKNNNISNASNSNNQNKQQERQQAPLPESLNDDNIKKDGKVAVDEKPLVITEEEIAQAEKEVNDDKNVINETEELMGLIAKAKDIREASLNGSMTDAERYEQAEKTAMRLAELFDLMGGGELNEIMG